MVRETARREGDAAASGAGAGVAAPRQRSVRGIDAARMGRDSSGGDPAHASGSARWGSGRSSGSSGSRPSRKLNLTKSQLISTYNNANSEDGGGDRDRDAAASSSTNGQPQHDTESIHQAMRVMSHNFGEAMPQFKKVSSVDPGEDKSLESAYMMHRADDLRAYERAVDSAPSDPEANSSRHADHPSTRTGSKKGVLLCQKEEQASNVALLSDWDFSVWDFSRGELVRLAWSMFHDVGVITEFQIPSLKFQTFVEAVFATSHDTPYHNFNHFFVVLHTSWLFLRTNPLVLNQLTPVDVLGCLTAAVGHDADHPGLTNGFLCAVNHPLAIRYNDLSVLENHHSATTYSILLRPECNIFCNLSKSELKDTRHIIVSAILNTDMARHFNLVANFTETVRTKPLEACFANRKIRSQIVSMVVHCADISNPIKPWAVCKRFADAVTDEFRNQVLEEKLHKIPCTPHMIGLDAKGQAKMEMGFMDVFTWPAMEALAKVFGNMEECFLHMEQNRVFWQDIMDGSGKSTAESKSNSATGETRTKKGNAAAGFFSKLLKL